MSHAFDAARAAADDSGLICGYRFEPGAPAREITLGAASELIASVAAERETADFLWLHFNLAHMGARRWLERADLPAAFHDALKEQSPTTRVERDENALVAILNDVHFHFGYEASEIATLWICVNRRLVVTARQSPLRSTDRLRVAIRAGEAIGSSVELLERLMRAQADVLIDILRNVTREVDRIEDEMLTGRLKVKRVELGVRRRLLVRLQRLLAPEPASLYRLLQHPPRWMAEGEAQLLRSASEEFSVALQDLAGVQERIKLLQEELSALMNERTANTLFVLTVVTVVLLPVNLISGLFGMNVGGMPLQQDPQGFWTITAIILTITGGCAFFALRRRPD
ncbi:MAG TPA: CorA family divalent cation transporter [Ramlibacter sp.]|uniref:CorA family divalent cation transporter n=1 Tax=Ramlibacter sp. TaxID=1917967 RepID=UPI002C2F5454|nr:CorA family divalent cation transporter [Ramlibacter sp.]HVZ44033.1 CorA family divalent cation transporter [Ramlibacter sp.]